MALPSPASAAFPPASSDLISQFTVRINPFHSQRSYRTSLLILESAVLLPPIFSGILAIYGLISSVIIANHIRVELSLYTALVNLGTGLAVGLCGLAAGFALGICGDAGVRSLAQQPRMFVSMVLILIFAEVLGELRFLFLWGRMFTDETRVVWYDCRHADRHSCEGWL